MCQVIRVPELVLNVHPSVCKLPTRELHVANKNCRKALSLTIRYGYLTAGGFAVICVQPPPYNIKWLVLSTDNGSTATADRYVSMLHWYCAMPCSFNSVSHACQYHMNTMLLSNTTKSSAASSVTQHHIGSTYVHTYTLAYMLDGAIAGLQSAFFLMSSYFKSSTCKHLRGMPISVLSVRIVNLQTCTRRAGIQGYIWYAK